jgi:hypothetical protein
VIAASGPCSDRNRHYDSAWTATDVDLLSGIAEFERDLILQRTNGAGPMGIGHGARHIRDVDFRGALLAHSL